VSVGVIPCLEILRFVLLKSGTGCVYNMINSIKSPASVSGNVSKPRLMSHVGRVRRVVCAGRSPAEIVGSNPTGGMDVCLL